MRTVFSVNDVPWQNLRGLPGARGFEYKALSDNDYSNAFNAELVRLEPGDHSVPHIEPWSHLLYFLSGIGYVTINGETQPVDYARNYSFTAVACSCRRGDRMMSASGTKRTLLSRARMSAFGGKADIRKCRD